MRIVNKQGTSRRFGLIVLVASIAFVASTLSVVAGDTYSFVEGDTLTLVISEQDQQAALAYFTPETIEEAQAFPMPVDYGEGGVDPAALMADEIVTGPAGSQPAGKADPIVDLISQKNIANAFLRQHAGMETSEAIDVDEILEVDQLADTEAGTASTYTYYDVNYYTNMWNVYPHKWMGKLTFTTPTGTASCSATVLKNGNIVTAAHCVYDTGTNTWYSGWVFTPSYRNGYAPYGTFSGARAIVLGAWANLTGSYSINSWARYDVAVIKLNKNAQGYTVNQKVGWAGYSWNASSNQLVFNSGYPARNYADTSISVGPAQYLRSCTAETFLQTTNTLGSGCYWGRGISGGSWLRNYKPFIVSGWVNSVNSGLYIGQQNNYGARFTDTNIIPLCSSSNFLCYP